MKAFAAAVLCVFAMATTDALFLPMHPPHIVGAFPGMFPFGHLPGVMRFPGHVPVGYGPVAPAAYAQPAAEPTAHTAPAAGTATYTAPVPEPSSYTAPVVGTAAYNAPVVDPMHTMMYL